MSWRTWQIAAFAVGLLFKLPALQAQSVTLVSFTNTVWSYDDTTTAAANYHGFPWYHPAFDASVWKTGLPLFGNDSAGLYDAPGQPFSGGLNGFFTPLDRSGGRITFYFRTSFNWPAQYPTTGVTLLSTNYVDDGCVIYLNGGEAGRIRLPNPPTVIAWDTTATNPPGEGVPALLELPAASLVTGNNVLAVEVHQSAGTSTDVAWAMKLVAVLPSQAPVITVQPESQTNAVGDTVSFSVVASGAEPLSYQWFFDATNAIAGATNATLSLTNLQLANAGGYSVVISNASGSVTSTAAQLILNPSGPVVVNPSFEANTFTVFPGYVSDNGPITGWTALVGHGLNPGAFGSPFANNGAIPDGSRVAFLQENGALRQTVSGFNIGSAYQLRYFENARFLFALPTCEVSIGGIVVVAAHSVTQVGGTNPYQAIASAPFLATSTAMELVFTKGNPPGGDSNDTTLLLDNISFIEASILQLKVDGSATTIAQTVTNAAVLSFQSAFSGGTVFYTLNGAQPGTGTLYTGPFLLSTSAVIRAIAYNTDYTEGAELDAVALTVVRSPVFTQQPVSRTVLTGQPAVFSAQASGSAPLSYQWYFNGAALAGATSASFARDGALVSHQGSYRVAASNPYGSATSTVAGLTVLLRPSIATQPVGTNVNTGQPATFCVSAIGSAPLVFQWRKNGVNLSRETNLCISITNVQAGNAGAYSVVVGNGADAVTSAEAVLVLADLPSGPPAEDLFANRNGLFGNSGALEANNLGATKEPGEPDHAGNPGGASVWYAWTPNNTGIATLRTSGSAFDTLLAVYRGSDVAALTPVAADEDGGGFLTSEVRFNATNGVPYQIAVDGFAAAQGSFVLSWNLEPTSQVLPTIASQPQSQTVQAGSPVTFNVSAAGSGLTYQWYFNGARLINATNSSFTRSDVQPADVGYYVVAVTNNQERGLFSDAAVLEIGPFADVRSVDKVEDLLGGPQPFQPASAGSASVAMGTLGTQVLNTTNSTTSFRETNHCGVIGGSSRWFKLKPAANGLMSVDTFGSTFDTVLAAYIGNALLAGYPTKLIDCDDNAAADVRWSRVLYPATNAIDYLIAVDGVGAASGTVQLNWSLGLAPVIVSNPPASSPLVGEGDSLQLTTALTNGLPAPKLQWYLNGVPITDATNATYQVSAVQRQSGGVYTVVAYNPVGSVTSVVANVSIEVPLELHLQPVAQDGKVHFRVSGVASQTFILQGSTNFVHWQPLYTNGVAGAPVSYDDHSTTNRSRRYYRALPWP